MKAAGIVFLVLAAMTAFVAASNLIRKLGDKANDPAELAGYAAGSLLIPIALAVLGLSMLRKSDRKGRRGRDRRDRDEFED